MDIERLSRELDRAGVKDACLACGNDKMTVDPSATVALIARDGDTINLDDARAIDAVALICNRWGFVRLHATHYLFGDG